MKNTVRTEKQLIDEIPELRQKVEELEKPLLGGQEALNEHACSNRVWEKAFDAITDLVMLLDVHHTIIKVNKAMAEKMGLLPSEAIGLKCYRYLHGTSEPPPFCPHTKLLSDRDVHSAEVYEAKLGGHLILTVTPLYDDTGKLIGSAHIAKNITLRKPMEEALRESEKNYRTLVDNALVGIYKTKLKGDFLFANEGLLKMLEFESLEEMITAGAYTRLKNPKDRKKLLESLKESGKVGNFECELITKNGRTKTVLLNAALEGDTLSGLIVDITERKKLESELEKLATTDRLTQAYNRIKFDEIMKREIERTRRYGNPLSIAIFDIDKFKEVNDSYGHLVGDYVLQCIAGIAKKNLRATDYLVRWGGDEFIIISPDVPIQGVETLAERIRKEIASYLFEESYQITVTLGVTQFRNNDTEDSFIKRADDALYRAKLKGKNVVESSL